MSLEQLETMVKTATHEINAVADLRALNDIRVNYLGKKGVLTEFLQGIGKMSPEERPKAGSAINVAKQTLENVIQTKKAELEAVELDAALNADRLDITLPGRRQAMGSFHPVNIVRERLENYFAHLGYKIAEGPEIEDDYHNFTALNIPEGHPARAMQDTFYFPDGQVLRTHTSPVQIRVLENEKPPVKIIAPGRVYRCDSDVTHTPMFHQLEALVVDDYTTFADLKGLLNDMLNNFFERELKLRFRPSYFPFTEPSAEVDIECVNCNAKGCRVCKGSGWLEVMGCGMVHPNVLTAVNIDPNIYQGFAFGLGLDRMAMLRYGIDDLRVMFENDIRFLSQF